MKLYMLPCLLEEDRCTFRTIKLEFFKAKEILEMHMKHVHERLDCICKGDNCDRDTNIGDDKEIIEDVKEAICDENNEALQNAPELLDDKKASTAERDTTNKNETSLNDDIAEVTLVTDDRDNNQKHFKEVQDTLEADNDAIEEIFKPDEVVTEPIPSCRNCGSPDHTSQRKIRRNIVQLGTFIVKCATKEDILKVVVMLIKLLQMMKASV